MESLGTFGAVIALEDLKEKIQAKNLLIWSCLFSFFMTSRYSSVAFIFIVSIYVLYLIFKSDLNFVKKNILITLYSAPLLLTFLCIFKFSLIHLSINLPPIHYLPYLSKDPLLLISPLPNLIYLILILLLIIGLLLKSRFHFLEKYKILLSLSIGTNALFILLSFLGKYPWCPLYNRGIILFTLAFICFSVFVGEIIKYSMKQHVMYKYYGLMSLLILCLFVRKKTLFVRQMKTNTYINFVKTDFSNINNIYVDRWQSPCVRYLFEYGKLKDWNKLNYPVQFTFGKFIQHNEYFCGNNSIEDFYKKQPKMDDMNTFDLMIASELFRQGFNNKWILLKGTSNFLC